MQDLITNAAAYLTILAVIHAGLLALGVNVAPGLLTTRLGLTLAGALVLVSSTTVL